MASSIRYHPHMEQTALEVLIVTGPLGSGKTTVVNRLLKRDLAQGRRVAVLINEFGAISIDGALVASERPELADIANLVNGCACCSLRGEVIATLAAWCDLPVDQRPERVVLETTGLADPADLVDLPFEPTLQGRLTLAGCLSVISCLTPLDHLERQPLLRHQALVASLIYISKVDLDPSLALAWESQLRVRTRTTPIVQACMGETRPGSPDPWCAGTPSALQDEPASGPLHARETRAIGQTWDHPIDPEALERLFRLPPARGEVLRAKGIASFQGWPAREDGSDRWAFQLADGRIEIMPLPTHPGQAPFPRMAVVIGHGLDAAAWRQALLALEQAP